jgi:CheY-like chemotaxis protein
VNHSTLRKWNPGRTRWRSNSAINPDHALTTLSSPDDQRRAFEAGYQAHMTKPVDSCSLIEAVAELAGD